MSQNQQTIKNEVSLSGVGLHTGKKVTMTFKPAPVNSGYAFERIDLEGKPIIEAVANYVVTTQRGTNLETNGAQINTSEHVLAAAYALGIDNLIIDGLTIRNSNGTIYDDTTGVVTLGPPGINIIIQNCFF